jgi:hypothetical protein
MEKAVKLYEGRRWGPNARIEVTVEEPEKGIGPLHHVSFHSPDGFEWGYGGSGPADLALSILADFYGEKPTKRQLMDGSARCSRHHQEFKWKMIASAPRDTFLIRAYPDGLFVRDDDPSRVIIITPKETRS